MYPRSLKERGRIEDFGNGGIMEYGDIIIIITKPKLAYDRQGLAGRSLCASGAQLGSGM